MEYTPNIGTIKFDPTNPAATEDLVSRKDKYLIGILSFILSGLLIILIIEVFKDQFIHCEKDDLKK